MSSPSEVREAIAYTQYKLELPEPFPDTSDIPVILTATLEPDSEAIFDQNRNDHTFNLSGMIGNDDGNFHWGWTEFQRTARDIHLEEENKEQFLVAELQDVYGEWKSRFLKLDDYIGLVDYVHPVKREVYYRLGPKIPSKAKRTLVLCFDGTSNHFSERNTNVVKLVDILEKDDPNRQRLYYQTGVGTYVPAGWATGIGEGLAKAADVGVAWYLYQHIIDGYRFLMETYRAGDKICLFGFSRGAFTARAVAGMIHCVGLLPRHNVEHIPFAYQLYELANDKKPTQNSGTKVADQQKQTGSASTNSDEEKVLNLIGALSHGNNPDPKLKDIDAEAFKRTFCIRVKIDFVGVWDTVASVGSFIPKTLPWIAYNPSIRQFRHALALDEHRANFVPSLWDHSRTNKDTQDVREVWFKGQHTDIGGGAPPPERAADAPKYTTLSNIALRWMVRQCIDADTPIIFDNQAIEAYRHPIVQVLEKESLKDSIALDKHDIVHKPYSVMGANLIWHLLEFWPSYLQVRKGDGVELKLGLHLYRPREIFCDKKTHNILIHSSVVDCMETTDYKPIATWSGFEQDDLPAIEDTRIDSRNVVCSQWTDKATESMNMNWKPPPPSYMAQVTSWFKRSKTD